MRPQVSIKCSLNRRAASCVCLQFKYSALQKVCTACVQCNVPHFRDITIRTATIDKKLFYKYFGNQLNVFHFLSKNSKYSLVATSPMWGFSAVLCVWKVNMFEFWIVGRTKQDIRRQSINLLIEKTICRLIDCLSNKYNHYLQPYLQLLSCDSTPVSFDTDYD